MYLRDPQANLADLRKIVASYEERTSNEDLQYLKALGGEKYWLEKLATSAENGISSAEVKDRWHLYGENVRPTFQRKDLTTQEAFKESIRNFPYPRVFIVLILNFFVSAMQDACEELLRFIKNAINHFTIDWLNTIAFLFLTLVILGLQTFLIKRKDSPLNVYFETVNRGKYCHQRWKAGERGYQRRCNGGDCFAETRNGDPCRWYLDCWA
eukprot:TRINITY_DN10775_c0_g1_i1.p1 TRINITY_DN10775_c0_g1~~TRINITY_DN10775_c0_g1_i1.p1  ORF type:complete len:211 (+),score=24.38 TRINITY_DN10775_c0_g1_i1:1-633(+)